MSPVLTVLTCIVCTQHAASNMFAACLSHARLEAYAAKGLTVQCQTASGQCQARLVANCGFDAQVQDLVIPL